jgi:hypothetical protein
MKPGIIYPIPLDNWDVFRPFVERFCKSWKDHGPGIDHHIYAVCTRLVTDEVKSLFDGMPVVWVDYHGNGCDIGAFQHVAHMFRDTDLFMVCCVTRVYAFKPGWLSKLISARNTHGPGLYGTSASKEGGNLHCCCRCYGMDASTFARYPTQITSREQGVFFEIGEGCLLDWYENEGMKCKMVYQDGVWDKREWFSRPNIFRDGDQSNMLVWDKHSDIYANGDTDKKTQLRALMLNGQ